MKKLEEELIIKEFKPVTILKDDTELEGEINFRETLEIRGKFKGKIKSDGVLIIAPEAEIEGEIKARIVILAGAVRGNIEASEKIDILSTGRLFGDIKTAKLRIADGVIFEGNCHMLQEKEL